MLQVLLPILKRCLYFTGPIASALTNKYGCRAVTIAGSIVSCCGFIMSIFAPNIWFMYFSFGIVGGMYNLILVQ